MTRTVLRFWLLTLAVLALPGLAYAEGGTPPEGAAPAKAYSPFAVALDGLGPFRVITFEDVGLHLDGALAGLLYEAISQSVASLLAASDELDYAATPLYEPRLSDPVQHVYCDEHHLYVALWRGFEPHRWGFSLWSGCGADDRFAWREVVAPFDDALALADLVEPLARAVVDALSHAERARCFRASC